MKKSFYRIRILILFSFLIICYLVEHYFYREYLTPVVVFAFPLILILIGVIWYKEKAAEMALQEAIEELKKADGRVRDGYLSTMKSLALAIEAKDPYTRGHSSRVVKYALLLAKELGLSEKEEEVIRNAGILHDIGKIAIADHILGKPGKLSEEEFDVIKRHPTLGVNILKPLSFLKAELSIVLEHHERVDGNGYHNLRKKDIPLASRIIAVADSYDAMTSLRPYRKAYSKAKALKELEENSGTQFDPEIVRAFLKVINRGKSKGKSTEKIAKQT